MTLHRCAVLTPEVEALLALAMWPDPARVRATLDAYTQNPELQVWTWTEAETPVCAAGYGFPAGPERCCTWAHEHRTVARDTPVGSCWA